MIIKSIKNHIFFLIIISIVTLTGCGSPPIQNTVNTHQNQIQNEDTAELYVSNQKIIFADKHVEDIFRLKLEKPEEDILRSDLTIINAYTQYKDKDGFLYILYSGESTFG